MNFGELIAKGGALFLRKKLSAVQAVYDAAPADEKAAFQASVSGGSASGPVSRPEAASYLVAAIARAYSGSGQVKIWTYGDSVGNFVSRSVVDDCAKLMTQTGWGGVAFNWSNAGGAADEANRPDISMKSRVQAVPSGGSTTYSLGGGARVPTKAAVWLAVEPTGGVCKVELIAADNITVTATVAASVNCSGAFGFTRVAWSGAGIAASKLRVTGLTGTCRVIDAYLARDDIAGMQNWEHCEGGVTPSLNGPVALAAMYDMLSYYDPTALFFTMREEPGSALNSVRPILLQYRALFPLKSIIVCGAWASTGDDAYPANTAPSYNENEINRESARQISAAFIDAWAIFPSNAALAQIDPAYDGTHLGAVGKSALRGWLYVSTGMFAQPGVANTQNTRNSLTSSLKLQVSADITAVPALDMVPAGSDVTLRGRRFINFSDQSASYPNPLEVQVWNGPGQLVLVNNSVGGASAAGNYSKNGQWALAVNPTTGVATLYGMVGGVLKSLMLGTLL